MVSQRLQGHTLPSRRAFGGAAPWLILVVVVLAGLGALALWGPGRGGPGPADPKDTAAPLMDAETLGQELAGIGDLFSQAMENQRDMQPVIDRLDKLVAQQPTAKAHTLHGQVLMYAGRSAEALAAFEASLELQPRKVNTHRLAGNLAMKLEQYDKARHHYEQARSIEPGKGEHAVYLANLQVKLNEDDQAQATLLTALRRDSQLHSAYALLSDIYTKKNKLGLALDQIQRAIETVPANNPNLRTVYVLKRAAILRRDNQPAESLATLNALPSDTRMQPKVLRDTATSWVMLGKPKMAAELYEQVLRIDPSSDLAAAEAARWRIKVGDTDAARGLLKTLRRINPRYEALVELEQKLGELDSTPTE